jgi:8-oxo-dGTP pyrophosphatase MutT (NUDIX family)
VHRQIRALVVAGGTREPVDDVRTLANSSTGRFGAMLAHALCDRGVDVHLLAARSLLRHREWLPAHAQTTAFDAFADLAERLHELTADPPDLVFMVAAISDYSPTPTPGKRPSTSEMFTIELTKNPKLLATLRERCGHHAVLVGFKLLSNVSRETLLAVAHRQRMDLELDLTVANDLRDLSAHQHPVVLVSDEEVRDVVGPREFTAGAVAERALELLDLPTPELPVLLMDTPPEADAWPVFRRLQRWVVLHRPVTSTARAWSPHGLEMALATGEVDGHTPLLVTHEGKLWLGLSDLDLAGWNAAWTAARKQLPRRGLPRPILHHGRLVAFMHTQDDVACLSLVPGEPPIQWTYAALRRQPHREWRVGHEDVALLQAAGFLLLGVHRDHSLMRGPWHRDDLVGAASVALFHGPTRRIMLGRRLTGAAQQRWAFPGGRVEAGETVHETALRELLEETGIDLPPNTSVLRAITQWAAPDTTRGAPAYAITCMLIPVLHAPTPTSTDELDAAWLPLDEAARRSDLTPGTRAVLLDLLHPR